MKSRKTILNLILMFMITQNSFAQNTPSQKGISNQMNYYEFYENKGKPVLILSHPMGTDVTIFKELLPFVTKNFSVLLYDIRGHGKSAVPNIPYTLDMFGNDVITMMDGLKIKEAYFCGVSISGMIAQWLAINAPNRITKAVVSNSTYNFQGEELQKALKSMQESIREKGSVSQSQAFMDFYFSKKFTAAHPERVAEVKKRFENTSNIGIANSLNASIVANLENDLKNITIPVFIIQGKLDSFFDPVKTTFMNQQINNSTLLVVNAAHVPAVEMPSQYADAITNFFIKN